MLPPVLRACDQITALVLQSATSERLDKDLTVKRTYQPIVYDNEQAGKLIGKHCYVYPLTYSLDLLQRVGDLQSYQVGILTAERFTDQGYPPDSWTDERVKWVYRNVYQVLRDSLYNGVLTIDPEELPNVEVYNISMMLEQKLFWSALSFKLRAQS